MARDTKRATVMSVENIFSVSRTRTAGRRVQEDARREGRTRLKGVIVFVTRKHPFGTNTSK